MKILITFISKLSLLKDKKLKHSCKLYKRIFLKTRTLDIRGSSDKNQQVQEKNNCKMINSQ